MNDESRQLELLLAVLSGTESELSESDWKELQILRATPEFRDRLESSQTLLEVAGAMVSSQHDAPSVSSADPDDDKHWRAIKDQLWKAVDSNLLLPHRVRIAAEQLQATADDNTKIALQRVAAKDDPAILSNIIVAVLDAARDSSQAAFEGDDVAAKVTESGKLYVTLTGAAVASNALVMLLSRSEGRAAQAKKSDLSGIPQYSTHEVLAFEGVGPDEYDLVVIPLDPAYEASHEERTHRADIQRHPPQSRSGSVAKVTEVLEEICFEVLSKRNQAYKTGFFIAKDGKALTTAHPDQWSRGQTCRIKYGSKVYEATVEHVDDAHDAVALQVKGVRVENLAPLFMKIELNQAVVVGAYQWQDHVKNLQVQGFRTPEFRTNYNVKFQDDAVRECIGLLPKIAGARTAPGSSGGPVLAYVGGSYRILGVVLAGQPRVQGQIHGNKIVSDSAVPYDWAMPLDGLFPEWPEFQHRLDRETKEADEAVIRNRRRRFIGILSILGAVALLAICIQILPQRLFLFSVVKSGNVHARYSTLSQAIEHAENGAVIEVGGNGPYAIEPLTIRGKALTIRAAAGMHPVFELKSEFLGSEQPLIDADESLVLEGLELRRVGKPGGKGDPLLMYLIKCKNASIYAAHCTFVLSPGADCVHSNDSAECVFTGCIFQGGHALSWHPPSGGRLLMENCLQVGGSAVHLHYDKPELDDVKITLANNTLIGIGERGESLKLFLSGDPIDLLKAGKPDAIQLTTRGNVFDADKAILKVTKAAKDGGALKGSETAQVIELLTKVISWNDKQNVYRAKIFLDGWGAPLGRSFSDWNKAWKIEGSGSVEGAPTYSSFSRASSPDLAAPLPALACQLDRLVTPGDVAPPPGVGAPVKFIGAANAGAEWQEHSDKYQRWLRLCRERPLAGIRIATVVAAENAWYEDYAVSQAFEALGAKNTTLSTQTGERKSQKKGEVLQPNITVNETIKTGIKQQSDPAQRCHVALICGGSGRRELLDQAKPDLLGLLTTLKQQGGFLVGIGDGVEVLAELDLLRDTRVTSHINNKSIIEIHGGTFAMQDDSKPSEFIRSGHVLTAESAKFQTKVVEALTAAIREQDFQ